MDVSMHLALALAAFALAEIKIHKVVTHEQDDWVNVLFAVFWPVAGFVEIILYFAGRF